MEEIQESNKSTRAIPIISYKPVLPWSKINGSQVIIEIKKNNTTLYRQVGELKMFQGESLVKLDVVATVERRS